MTKILGYGTIVKVDHDDNAAFTAVGCLKDATPPKRSIKTADATCLDDSREDMQPGIADATEFTFTHFWEIGEASNTMIDTLFSNAKSKTTPYDVDWQVIYPLSTPVTEAFSGWVKEISPETIKVGEFLTRQVTVMTTSVSTLS